jgi:hypothetical protein
MTEPTAAGPSAITRVRAVVYAPCVDSNEQDAAIALCAKWAEIHDWSVVAVVRESDQAPVPFDRIGIRAVLDYLAAHRGTVALAASRRHIAAEAIAFHAVCAEAERSGGFLHVLGEPKEEPLHAP